MSTKNKFFQFSVKKFFLLNLDFHYELPPLCFSQFIKSFQANFAKICSCMYCSVPWVAICILNLHFKHAYGELACAKLNRKFKCNFLKNLIFDSGFALRILKLGMVKILMWNLQVMGNFWCSMTWMFSFFCTDHYWQQNKKNMFFMMCPPLIIILKFHNSHVIVFCMGITIRGLQIVG